MRSRSSSPESSMSTRPSGSASPGAGRTQPLRRLRAVAPAHEGLHLIGELERRTDGADRHVVLLRLAAGGGRRQRDALSQPNAVRTAQDAPEGERARSRQFEGDARQRHFEAFAVALVDEFRDAVHEIDHRRASVRGSILRGPCSAESAAGRKLKPPAACALPSRPCPCVRPPARRRRGPSPRNRRRGRAPTRNIARR